MNKITATGRVVADAEVRFNQSGDSICSFRVASDVGYGDKKSVNWFNCAIWGKRGESIAPYLQKGAPVTVFGTLTLREWVDREGFKQLSPDIRIDEIEMHGAKPDQHPPAPETAPQQRAAAPQTHPAPSADDLDKIPF